MSVPPRPGTSDVFWSLALQPKMVHVSPRHTASSPGQGRAVTVTVVRPLASCVRDGDTQLAVPRIPAQSHLPMKAWTQPTGDQHQRWERTKFCWVPGRCPHLGKAMALTHGLWQVLRCPCTPGKETCVQLPIYVQLQNEFLFSQQQAAVHCTKLSPCAKAGLQLPGWQGVLPAGWAPPGPNPYGGTGEPCTCSWLVGGTEEPHRPHPQGVPKDVREPALVLAGARSRSHRMPSPAPCASAPLGIWPKLCFPEPSRGWLLRYPQGSIRPWLPVQGGKGKFAPGSEICSHLRLDADGLSISGINVAVVPAPRVWVGAG